MNCIDFEVDADTQKDALPYRLIVPVDDLISAKARIALDGRYKPHSDEFLAIENCSLSDGIKDAIRDPLGVPTYPKRKWRVLRN